MGRRTLRVTGMSCSGCEETVESALGDLEGVTRVEADRESESVDVVADDDVSDEALTDAVRDAGYEATGQA